MGCTSGASGGGAGKFGTKGRNASTAEKKPMSINEMIAKGMTPEEIKAYREKQGFFKPTIYSINGVKGSAATTWEDVSNSSPNTIWVDGKTPHALLQNEKGSVRVKGDKNDRYALLNAVNTAVVHIPSVSSNGNFTKRDATKTNKVISEIKSMGFDTPKISTNRSGETIVFAKRNRFTKEF